MFSWLGKFIAGAFIQSELDKVKVELKNMVTEIVKDSINEAVKKMQSPQK